MDEQKEGVLEATLEAVEISFTDEVRLRLLRIALMFLDLLGQKKFWVAISSGIATYQLTGDAWAILYAALAYVGAQGIADLGKYIPSPIIEGLAEPIKK